jgi:hypothetical protein
MEGLSRLAMTVSDNQAGVAARGGAFMWTLRTQVSTKLLAEPFYG